MLNQTALFPPKSVHQDWLLAWEFSIPDQDLREEMLENPRINQTIVENIARINKLAPLQPDQLTRDITNICQIIADDVDKFANTCGLALMGNALRKLITPQDLELYIHNFELQTIQTAMQAKIDYPPFSTLNFEPDHLQEVVKKAGYRTIVGWSWSLEPSIGGRVRMLLPSSFSALSELTETIDPAIAAKTVTTVSNLFMETGQLQQAA